MRYALIMLAVVAAVAGLTGVAGSQTTASMTRGEYRDAIRDGRAALQKARVRDCREWRTKWRYPNVSRLPADRLDNNLRYIRSRVAFVRDLRPLCHEGLWQCVHRWEGRWNDPGAPYFGGLQMGFGFMRAYGDRQSFGRNIYRQEGTADHWSEREQIAVADGAHRENGRSTSWLGGQWPGSPSECGRHL